MAPVSAAGVQITAMRMQHSFGKQDSIADGMHQVSDDDTHGFFAKGRDFESVGTAHAYTRQEMELLNSFESIEYLPANNTVYREYLSTSQRSSQRARWLAMGLIGLAVGTVGFLNKTLIELIAGWRRRMLYKAMLGSELPPECLEGATQTPEAATYSCGYAVDPSLLFPVFAGMSIFLACAAAAVVVLIQPAAASSGIPEVIAYLNGTHQRKIFNVRTLTIKFISCVFAVSSGLPVGPEGPMIHMGAMIGRGVSQMRSRTLGFAMPLFAHFRNAKDARDFLTAGAAAGVASAFGAPVGGLLFALEEVASTWSQTLTWQTFFSAMVATTTTVMLFAGFAGFKPHPPFGQLHANGDRASIEFFIEDGINVNILLFIPTVIIGAICGVLGSAFTFINLKIAKFRRKRVAPHKALRILEPMLIMLILALFTTILTLAWPCTDAVHAHPSAIEDALLVRFTCPEGHYNEIATLMLNSGHSAVHILFLRHGDDGTGRFMFGGGSVFVFFLVYFVLAAWSAGSAISSGLVVPMLLIGATVGRIVGILFVSFVPNSPLHGCDLPAAEQPQQCFWKYVDPGAFALIGASAFFGGVSRLTIALTVIMVEITNDVRFILPIMLGVMVAKWVADSLTHSLYHAIIEAKCLPFLNPEVSLHGVQDGDLERFTLADLLRADAHRPPVRTLHAAGDATALGEGETYGSCARLLLDTYHGAYPIVDSNKRFAATITRAHLTAVLVAGASGRAGTVMSHEELLAAEERMTENPTLLVHSLEKCAEDHDLSVRPIDLSPYINPSAISLRSDFSLHRAYMVFRTMGLRHLVVTNIANEVTGVITRKDLMDFKLHDVLHPHGAH